MAHVAAESWFEVAVSLLPESEPLLPRPDLLASDYVRVLPEVQALFRLWASVAPSRALGAAAGVTNPALRLLARLSALQTAPWPSDLVVPARYLAVADWDLHAHEVGLDEAQRADLEALLASSATAGDPWPPPELVLDRPEAEVRVLATMAPFLSERLRACLTLACRELDQPAK